MTLRELMDAAKNDEPLDHEPTTTEEIVMAFGRGPRRSPVHFCVTGLVFLVVVGIALVQLSVPRTLHVASSPSGARVVVDGRDLGATPLDLTRLGRGDHKLELRKDGYEPKSAFVGINAGAPSSYAWDLTALKIAPPPEPPSPPAGPAVAMLDRTAPQRDASLAAMFSDRSDHATLKPAKAKKAKKAKRGRRR